MKFEKDERFKAFGLINEIQKWPNGTIPYEINTNIFNFMEQALIISAMNMITNKTDGCIKFRLKTSDSKNWISINSFNGCWSYVGILKYTGGPQDISLGRGCVYKGTIVHELMHAIGFMHEQNR